MGTFVTCAKFKRLEEITKTPYKRKMKEQELGNVSRNYYLDGDLECAVKADYNREASEVLEKKKKKKKKRKFDLEEHSLPPTAWERENRSTESRTTSDEMENREIKKKSKKGVSINCENVPKERQENRKDDGRFQQPIREGEMSTVMKVSRKNEDKRVSFQNQVNKERLSSASSDKVDPGTSRNSLIEESVIWGTRFTEDEDGILKDAVEKYIKEKGWSWEEGVDIILNCSNHKEARNCWNDIQASLPHRPRQAVRYRGYSLLGKGNHLGRWSTEDEETLRRLESVHGHNWKLMEDILGRGRSNIKEKWRSLKREHASGTWTQNDLQRLSDKVHHNFQIQAELKAGGIMEKKEDRHILKNNLNWEKIADSIGNHDHGSCCNKWYRHLVSSLVASGDWADEDDFLLLKALLESGANIDEEVEWDSLLKHRSGQICCTRWKQMVKHLGENRQTQFGEKLYLLTRRYAPDLLENT